MRRTSLAALLLALPLADALPAQVPNGHLLVSAHNPNRIYVLDPTGDVVQKIPVFGRGIALGYAGQAITIGSEDSWRDFLRFDLATGEALEPVPTHTLDDMDVAVFGDGTLVVISPNDDVVRAVDPTTGDVEWSVPFTTTIWSATVDADDRLWVGDSNPNPTSNFTDGVAIAFQ